MYALFFCSSDQIVFWRLQLGQYKDCLGQLEAALQLSQELKDHSHDADILGEMADAHADLGNFEQAAKVRYPISLLTQHCREFFSHNCV